MCEKQTQMVVEETQPEVDCSDETNDDTIWGRLFPIHSAFQSVELKKDLTTFGRRTDCDVNLANGNTDICTSSAYSNLHFTIKREFSGKTGLHAMLEDGSSNGTFINGEKIGKGRIQALKNNCEIALSKKENKAFIFIDLSNKEDKNYPPAIRQKYTITKQLGVGAYGEVRLAFEKDTCSKFAIKIIQKKKFTMNGRNQLNLNSHIISEINILKKIEHPCIIKIKEVVDTPEAVFIVLDLVEGGELFDKVVKIGQYDESTAKLLFYQMVLAIKYLHDQGISHRDLKPENILLCSFDRNDTLIKVTDFGLSKFFNETTMMQTFCGTPNYLAPEVLITRGEGKYTNKIDNWSLGVILYICLVGYPPFSEENTSVSLEKQIKEGLYDFPNEFWSEVSEHAKDVVKKLMCVDSTKRATLEEILEHEWIKADVEMKKKADKLMYPETNDLVKVESKQNGNEPKRKIEDDESKKNVPVEDAELTNFKRLKKSTNSNATDDSTDQ